MELGGGHLSPRPHPSRVIAGQGKDAAALAPRRTKQADPPAGPVHGRARFGGVLATQWRGPSVGPHPGRIPCSSRISEPCVALGDDADQRSEHCTEQEIGPGRPHVDPTLSGRARRRGCIRCLRRSACPRPGPRPGPGGPPQTSRVGGSPTRDSRPATPGRNQLPATRDPERSWPPGPARTFVKCPARSGHLSGSGLKLFLYCNTSEYIHEFISKYLRI